MSAVVEKRRILKKDGDDDDGPSLYFPHKDNNNRYDMNSKIMLIAIISLSVVVLLVLALHIYARYVLRRQERRRRSAIHHLGLTVAHARSADHNHHSPNKTGLDPSVIASLPIFAFQRFDTTPSSVPDCAVCLSPLDDGDMARLLPNCAHTFHVGCIDKWLSSQSTCPICRTAVEPRRLDPEPHEGPVESSTFPASAPPLEGLNSASSCMEGTSLSSISDINSGKMLVNNSTRLSSFRRILSRERSSRRIQPCGQQDQDIVIEDLERQ